LTLVSSRPDHKASLPTAENDARWDDYTLRELTQRHPLAWLIDRWRYEEPLYREIQRLVPEGGRILEVGSGGGPSLLWLGAHGYEVAGVEYRPRVVEAARALAHSLKVDVTYEVGDAFDLSAYRGFDLVFSIGMVEHWPYERSVAAIAEQAKCARTVVVVIPTRFTSRTAEVTDERFYSRAALSRMLADANLAGPRVIAYGDVAGFIGRASRTLLPELPYKRLLQRKAGWPSGTLAGIGTSTDSAPR
jgi:SAM-dependent methyltransferase